MVSTKYAYQLDEHTASAYGKGLPISTKTSINICNAVRNLSVARAVKYLENVAEKKEAIPFTRFTDGVGHRPGKMAAGRYPLKAATAIKDLIKSAAQNAEAKGFSDELKIVHISANKASTPMHQGRQRRRSMKRTHVQVVVKETQSKKAKPKAKAQVPKAESKKEIPAPKKEVKETKSTEVAK